MWGEGSILGQSFKGEAGSLSLSSGQAGMALNQARISEEEETGCQRNGLLVIASGRWRNVPEVSSTEILARFVLSQEKLSPD